MKQHGRGFQPLQPPFGASVSRGHQRVDIILRQDLDLVENMKFP